MAVQSQVKSTKVVLKLEKGSQTISNCNPAASDEALYNLAEAVADLEANMAVGVTKVVETTLVSE